MNKNRCTIIDLYQVLTLTGVAFTTWKIAHHWHAGLAEKTGRTIDATISAAAKKLEKSALALEKWANGGTGENLGKDLDKVLTGTKKTLESATDLVQRALTKKQQSEHIHQKSE